MLSRKFWLLFLAILPLLAAACGSDANRTLSASELASLPTLVPSATPSLIPSETPVPTDTPVPTATETLTRTPEPTDTLIPTNTPTFTRMPTETRIPSATATATTALTNTPIPSPTPTGPTIVSFTSSTTSANGNTPITLVWEASGASAIIEQLDQQGNSIQIFDVELSGNLTVTLPTVGPNVFYRLVISGADGQEVLQQLAVQVLSVCPAAWFFANAPADAGCPGGPATSVQGQWQRFQKGIMANFVYNGQNQVYGFNTNDSRYAVYASQWDGTSVYSDPNCGTPTFGSYNPVGVFNWAFFNTLGTLGPWCNPTNGLGWAVIQQPTTAQIRIQVAQQSTTTFIEIQGYGILRLSGGGINGTWSLVQ